MFFINGYNFDRQFFHQVFFNAVLFGFFPFRIEGVSEWDEVFYFVVHRRADAVAIAIDHPWPVGEQPPQVEFFHVEPEPDDLNGCIVFKKEIDPGLHLVVFFEEPAP